jgi:hypothetical protein
MGKVTWQEVSIKMFNAKTCKKIHSIKNMHIYKNYRAQTYDMNESPKKIIAFTCISIANGNYI